MGKKTVYFVFSKDISTAPGSGAMPTPEPFETKEEAERNCAERNKFFSGGHPGYFVNRIYSVADPTHLLMPEDVLARREAGHSIWRRILRPSLVSTIE